MPNVARSLPEAPDDLRQFTALLLAEVKSQAVLIEKLRLALETSGIAIVRMAAKPRLPDEEPKDKPKRPRSRITSRAWKSK